MQTPTNAPLTTPPPEEIAATTLEPLQGCEREAPSAAVLIDQVWKQKFEVKFNETINNPRFWANPKRAERLDQALTIPVYDEKSLQQFFISAREELIREAMETAIKNYAVPAMPTEDQIRERAEEKHEAKLAKEAEKAAKKSK